MFVPKCRRDQFIDSLPEGWNLIGEEREEMNKILGDKLFEFHNSYNKQRNKKMSPNTREISPRTIIYEEVHKILKINPTSYESASKFNIPFEDPGVQEFCIGYYNSLVYEYIYKTKKNKNEQTPFDCHINKADLSKKASRSFKKRSRESQTNRGFSRSKDCERFGFTLLYKTFVSIIRSLPNYPNGKEVSENADINKFKALLGPLIGNTNASLNANANAYPIPTISMPAEEQTFAASQQLANPYLAPQPQQGQQQEEAEEQSFISIQELTSAQESTEQQTPLEFSLSNDDIFPSSDPYKFEF